MRKLKFRFWKDKKLQGILELKTNNILDMGWEWDSVDQFTGLLDKAGKEIYEGDIVRFHQFLFDGQEHEEEGICVIKGGDYGWIASNIIHDGVGEYMGYCKQDQLSGKVECYFFEFHGLHEESFEIIGNIYESPELLNHPQE